MGYRGHRNRHFALAVVSVAAAISLVGIAQASAAEFRSGASPAKVRATNTNNHVFTAGLIGSISCTSATFTGTSFIPSPSKEIEVAPAYSGCTFLGVANVVVNMNGCTYVFKQPTGAGPFTGKVDVKCPEGKKISFSASGCTVEVGAQTGLGTVTYTNENGKEWVKVDANVTGITYKGSALCPNAPGEHSDGTYKGIAKAIAENEAEEVVNAWVE